MQAFIYVGRKREGDGRIPPGVHPERTIEDREDGLESGIPLHLTRRANVAPETRGIARPERNGGKK